MLDPVDVKEKLNLSKTQSRRVQEHLVSEAHRLVQKDVFSDKRILDNLKHYSRSFDVLDENEVDEANIYSEAEIRRVAVNYRLKFLDSQLYKPEIPYDAFFKTKELNKKHHKDLKGFKILGMPADFAYAGGTGQAILFCQTNCENYYLVHRWGAHIEWSRTIKFWPLRHFENLLVSLLVFTLLLTLSLPTALITLDSSAEYWSGYRAAAFFHLLIFNTGFTAYVTFAFSKNFSSTTWNRKKDFG